jgi:hypothetical protein
VRHNQSEKAIAPTAMICNKRMSPAAEYTPATPGFAPGDDAAPYDPVPDVVTRNISAGTWIVGVVAGTWTMINAALMWYYRCGPEYSAIGMVMCSYMLLTSWLVTHRDAVYSLPLNQILNDAVRRTVVVAVCVGSIILVLGLATYSSHHRLSPRQCNIEAVAVYTGAGLQIANVCMVAYGVYRRFMP